MLLKATSIQKVVLTFADLVWMGPLTGIANCWKYAGKPVVWVGLYCWKYAGTERERKREKPTIKTLRELPVSL
jgi:hypothetical protein